MGTMRSVFTKSFIILPLLAFSWIQAFPSSPSKNLKDLKDQNEGETSFPPLDTLSSHPLGSSDANIYSCYDVSPNSPACNFKDEEQASNEINTNSIENTRKDVTRVVVYEMQGCRPYRLPFKVPRCTEADRAAKNVEVYKFRVFWSKKDMWEPPSLFPVYNSQHWAQPLEVQSQ